MYLRTTTRSNRDGSVVRYLALAHNEWDPDSGQSKAKVLYHFGREDQVDREAIARLVTSLSRLLEPGVALAAKTGPGLSFLDSRPMGGAWVLDALWRRVGIDAALTEALSARRVEASVVERVIFAMVANQALKPLSKLAGCTWVGEQAFVPGLDKVDEDACYRAMDLLLEVEDQVAETVFWSVAHLLNLEVDLVLFDTTSTYFEVEGADPAEDPDNPLDKGFRTHGHSKDHRGDLPQVVVGMAMTRDGIPIRVWTWPGNTSDQTLIRQVKDDLRSWRLGRVIWAADRGFSSAVNRRYLQRGGDHYIIGEKLRGDSKEAAVALSRQGRYHVVAGNLEVKEVVIDDGTMRDRFVICRNPDEAVRDQLVREQLVAQLQGEIDSSDTLGPTERAELAGALKAMPGYARYLRVTKGGLLRVDRGAIAAEARLDGKFLLRTSDPSISADDVALAYKALCEVERGWREMKSIYLRLRPVYHHLERRIRAHVLLCWLALLLIRTVELAANQTWRNVRNEVERMHVGTFAGPGGAIIRERTETTHGQRAILGALEIPEPPRFIELTPAPAAPTT